MIVYDVIVRHIIMVRERRGLADALYQFCEYS